MREWNSIQFENKQWENEIVYSERINNERMKE